MLRKWFFAGALFAASISSAHAAYTPFSINLNYQGGLSSSQLTIFNQAKSFWQNQILGYSGPVKFTPGLTINTFAQNIDGLGGTLGSAGPSGGVHNSGTGLNNILYATQGNMQFDTADLNWLESNGQLFDVVVHEMAHVIGFGTLWTYNSLYVNNSGQYTGSYAVDMYKKEFNATTNYVPVELNIGPGSDNGHWSENWLGGERELMTSYLSSTPFLSLTTLASFRDLGYEMAYTVLPEDVPAPLTGVLVLMSVSLLWTRRRHS